MMDDDRFELDDDLNVIIPHDRHQPIPVDLLVLRKGSHDICFEAWGVTVKESTTQGLFTINIDHLLYLNPDPPNQDITTIAINFVERSMDDRAEPYIPMGTLYTPTEILHLGAPKVLTFFINRIDKPMPVTIRAHVTGWYCLLPHPSN
jgi:hypothetical protein